MTDPQRIAAALGKIGYTRLVWMGTYGHDGEWMVDTYKDVVDDDIAHDCAEARLCRWAEERRWRFSHYHNPDMKGWWADLFVRDHPLGPFPTKLDACVAAVEAEK